MRSKGQNQPYDEAQERYVLQMALRGWGEAGQARLQAATVFVAGTDQPGLPLFTLLAAIGIGRIRLGNFGIRNERASVEVVRALIAAMNPAVELELVGERIPDGAREHAGVDPAALDAWVGDADLIFDSAGRIDTKFLLAASAERKGVPFIYHGTADLCAFVCPLLPPVTPRFTQLFDERKLGGIGARVAQVIATAERLGVGGPPIIPAVPPATYAAAAMAVAECVKILLGVGTPAYNRFLLQVSAGDAALRATTLPLVRQWLRDEFLRLCTAQGFDWRQVWNGRFLQEFDLTPLHGAG